MSLFGGVYDIHQGTAFTNVIGSADDINVTEADAGLSNSTRRMGWFELWSKKTGCGTNRIRCMACGTNRATLGGHIVLRRSSLTDASRYKRNLIGSNRVFIAPICPVCNGRNYNSMNNELVFQAQYQGKVVHLWGFSEDSILPFSMTPGDILDSNELLDAEMDAYANRLSERRTTEAVLDTADYLLLYLSPVATPSAYASPSRPARIRNSAQSPLYHYY